MGVGDAPRALPGHPDALPAHANHRPEQPNALPEHPDACKSPPRAAECTQPLSFGIGRLTSFGRASRRGAGPWRPSTGTASRRLSEPSRGRPAPPSRHCLPQFGDPPRGSPVNHTSGARGGRRAPAGAAGEVEPEGRRPPAGGQGGTPHHEPPQTATQLHLDR